jgi:hypothetical protein
MNRANRMVPVHASSQSIGCANGSDAVSRVMSELDGITRENIPQPDHIVEELKRCPEAFQVGEILARILDTRKYDPDQRSRQDGSLPPAGAVVPPLV